MNEETTRKVSELAHDLFIDPKYSVWKENLAKQSTDRWFSLVVELDKSHCPIDELFHFDEAVRSKLVYRCVPSPHYKRSGEIMVLFNIAGFVWHSLVYFVKSND